MDGRKCETSECAAHTPASVHRLMQRGERNVRALLIQLHLTKKKRQEGGASLSEAYTVGGEERVHRLVAMLPRAMLEAGVAAQGGRRCVAHPRAICAEGATEQSKQSKQSESGSGPAATESSSKRRETGEVRAAKSSRLHSTERSHLVALRCHCAATALPLCCSLASAHPPPLSAAFGPPCVTALICLAFGSAALQFPTDARQHRPPFAPPSLSPIIAIPSTPRVNIHPLAPRPATRSPTLSFALSHRGAHRFTRFGPTLFPSLHPAVCTSSSQWRAIVLRP